MPISTANLDAGADSPALARVELKLAVDLINAVGPLRTDLAAPTGAALVFVQPDGTGADAVDLQTAARRHFIDGDAWIKTSYSGATNVTRWSLLVAYINTLAGGAEVRISRGAFPFNGPIAMAKKMLVIGEGRQSTFLQFSHTGDGIQSTWPTNSSTGVWVGLRDLAITSTNGANAGGGFADVGGTFVDVFNIYCSGWKYGVILDQTEIVTIENSEFVQPSYGTAGIWIANGPDHTALAATGFTNRLTISKNQFNAAAGAGYNILNDGGVNHTFRDNNFNAGLGAMRAAGVLGFTYENNESEGHTGNPLYLTNTTLAGAYVGPVCGLNIGGGSTFSDITAAHISIDDARGGRITDNFTCQAVGQFIVFNNGNSNLATGLTIEGNSKGVTGASKTAAPFVNASTLQPYRNNTIRQVGMSYSVAACGSGAQTITPASMEFINVGTRLIAQNADGSTAEVVQVTAKTATTFTATFVGAKTANFVILGTTPADQEEGSWTPTVGASTANGTHTYSVQTGQYVRRGNLVHVKGSISISAKDAALAGTVSIKGLPFAAQNVTNGNAVANIGLFGGFTFSAGYSVLSGLIQPTGTSIDLRKSGSAVALSVVAATDIPSTTLDLYFDATYYTSGV